MKKNEMKHLSAIHLDKEATHGIDAVVIMESIKNTVMGCPRYEATVYFKEVGAYKVLVEGYKGYRDLAYDAFNKVIDLITIKGE